MPAHTEGWILQIYVELYFLDFRQGNWFYDIENLQDFLVLVRGSNSLTQSRHYKEETDNKDKYIFSCVYVPYHDDVLHRERRCKRHDIIIRWNTFLLCPIYSWGGSPLCLFCRGLVEARASLDAVVKRKIPTPAVVWSLAGHSIDSHLKWFSWLIRME
jgi:hypothetical protein